MAELDAYFEAMRPSLAVTPAAREAYRLILLPPMRDLGALPDPGPAGVGRPRGALGRPAAPVGAADVLAAGLGLTDAAATAALRAFRQAMLRLPQRARRSPIVWAGFERVAVAEPAA